MATHRYWRVRRLEAYDGGALELSAFHLLDGATRMDNSAALTSSLTPISGSLADLQDSNLSTSARWISTDGLVFNWDFGSAVNVTDIRLGSTDSKNTFLLIAVLEFSDDGVSYTHSDDFIGIAHPGRRALTSSPNFPVLWSLVQKGPDTSVSANRLVATCANTDSVLTDAPKMSGVWQVEMTASKASSTGSLIGVSRTDAPLNTYPGGAQGSYGYYSVSGEMYSVPESTVVGVPYGATFSGSDIMGIVLNFDDNLLTFYKNGVSQGGISVDLSIGAWSATVGSDTNTGATNTGTLRTSLLYPVPGADQWVSNTVAMNIVKGRTTLSDVAQVESAGAAANYSGTKYQSPLRARPDFITGGTGRILGTVKEFGSPETPVRRRVRLIRERDGMLVQEQWSNGATGAYDFQYVEIDHTYTVLSYDHFGHFRAVVADKLVPEVMP